MDQKTRELQKKRFLEATMWGIKSVYPDAELEGTAVTGLPIKLRLNKSTSLKTWRRRFFGHLHPSHAALMLVDDELGEEPVVVMRGRDLLYLLENFGSQWRKE